MMEDIKNKSHAPFWLILIIVGIVLIIVGVVISRTFGVSKYFPKEDIYQTFKSEEINNLNIDSGIGKINIKKSNDNNIIVDCTNLPKDRYEVTGKNNTLKIAYKQKWFDFADNSIFHNKNEAEITVYLPEKEYDNFEFDGGVGENNITDISVKNASVDCGVGESVFKNFKVTNKADIDIGVGETKFENCELNKSDIDTGVGELYFSGKISGYTEIDMGVGEAEFNIDGFKNEYDIDYDKGVGEVNISGSETSYITSVPIKIDLDCGVGEVTFKFK